MKIYSHHGFHDFIILAGYKQHIIKEWFANYFLHTSDITFDFTHDRQEMIVHQRHYEPWKVTVIDTGMNTMTGGRIKRAEKYVGKETFMLTYGDAVGNINITDLLNFHKSHGKIGTVSAFSVGQNKGVLELGKDGNVNAFREKSGTDGNLINIGFMVFEPNIFDYINNDQTVFEKDPLNKLVELGELNAYLHKGFWQCMDTIREREELERLWAVGNCPWKEWV